MLGVCNGRFSASPETQSKSFRGGARSYFRLISVQPMKQRWFRGLTISNQRTEMTRSYNISRQSSLCVSIPRRLDTTLGVRPTFLAISDGYEIPGKCQPHGELFRYFACRVDQLLRHLMHILFILTLTTKNC